MPRTKKTWLENHKEDIIRLMIIPFMEQYEVFDKELAKKFMDDQYQLILTDLYACLRSFAYFVLDFQSDSKFGERRFNFEEWERNIIKRFLMEAHHLTKEEAKLLTSRRYSFFYGVREIIEFCTGNYDKEDDKVVEVRKEFLCLFNLEKQKFIKASLIREKDDDYFYVNTAAFGLYAVIREIPANPLNWVQFLEHLKGYLASRNWNDDLDESDFLEVYNYAKEFIGG